MFTYNNQSNTYYGLGIKVKEFLLQLLELKLQLGVLAKYYKVEKLLSLGMEKLRRDRKEDVIEKKQKTKTKVKKIRFKCMMKCITWDLKLISRLFLRRLC